MPNNTNKDIQLSKQVKDVALIEESIFSQLEKIKSEHPDVFEQIEYIEDQKKKVNEFKDKIKQYLIDTQDFDLHRIDDVAFSVSKIAKVDVENIDDISDEYKEMTTTANTKKATEYMKLMGSVPSGFKDKSYYRLNWKKDGKKDD